MDMSQQSNIYETTLILTKEIKFNKVRREHTLHIKATHIKLQKYKGS